MSSPNPAEYRHMRTGSLNIPPQNGHANGMMSPIAGPQRFDGGPRSPPNTSHVPCKFFRQGACQAGNACPFSHDLGQAAENVCKYFAKGNCKFGPKCANIHVLPDGRRINYSKNGVTIGAPPVALGARVNPNTYHQPSNSALTNSFLRADPISPYTATNPFAMSDDPYTHQLSHRPSMENGLPTIDTTYTSNPTSVYGSPRDEEVNRFGLGLSPVAKGLSVLDAPLPASFDSNGISHAARYGPWPSSMPSKFGLESPSASFDNIKDGRTSDTLKLLHTQAFGSDHLSPSSFAAIEENGFGSSPPTGSTIQSLALGGDEYFPKRPMHSSLRYAKSRLMSSSAPKIDRDWESGFLFEEDMVPGTLANEVLTPAEKARRGSATNTVRAGDGLESLTESVPIATKFGSPVTGASPSRWGPYFQRQKEEEAAVDLNSGSYGGGSSRSFKHASVFGHVGSPLRNSSLASGITAELNGDSRTGRPGLGSRQESEAESFSVLTQQMQRARLGDEGSGSSSPHLHPSISRNPSGTGVGSIGSGIIGKERERERGLERHISSGSIGSSPAGRFGSIDEEDPAFVFNMEEEDDSQLRARKRTSGVHMGAASPLSSAWSYAAAAANNRNTPGVVGSTSAHNGGGAVEAVGGR